VGGLGGETYVIGVFRRVSKVVEVVNEKMTSISPIHRLTYDHWCHLYEGRKGI
jgi:hypothetical protein